MRKPEFLNAALIAAALLTGGAMWTLHDQAPAREFDRAMTASDAQVLHEGGRVRFLGADLPKLVAPDGTQREVASLLDLPGPMTFGDFTWNEQGAGPGPVWVQVDPSRQLISVFRGGNEIGSAVIIYGSDGKPTPSGVFPVLAKARDHQSSLYDAAMPFTLRLTRDGVAIHASEVARAHATHGCVGVPPGFAEHLFAAVRVGDPVVIATVPGSARRV